MNQIVSSTSLTFRFSSPYGCKPKPHPNKHVPYPNKHPTNNTHRLNKLLTSFHLNNIERPFYLERKVTKRQNGTVSVNGIIHGSSLDRWHLMTQVLASLPPARSQVKKLGSCRQPLHSNYLQRIDPPWNEKTARTWKMVVGKLLLIFGPCLFSGAMWVFGEGNPFWEIHFC